MALLYKIIGDSCCDLPFDKKKDEHYALVPLTLSLDDVQIVDDESFDQQRFIRLVSESPNCPKSACPSPEAYCRAIEESDAKMVFIITLSKELSGSYNSARLGKEIYIEEHGEDKKILVINSMSASGGEYVIAKLIERLCSAGKTFEEITERISEFTRSMKTWFVLESLDILKKNGRLSGIKSLIATALNIKPVMSADMGVITQIDKARGVQNALLKMISKMKEYYKDTTKLDLVLAHCNNYKRAIFVKEELEKNFSFRSITIVETGGVSTMYASDGGIIVAA